MTRTIETRYSVLRGGGRICDILAAEPAQLRMDDTSAIKSSLTGVFFPDKRVNWLTDSIRPELIIDGTAYPLGIYRPTTVQTVRTETTVLEKIEAFDQCWTLQDYKTTGILSLAQGTNYIDAIQSLVVQATGLQVIATPTSWTLTEIREDWDVGTGYLTIINELLKEINYKEIYFNAQGLPMLEPFQTPTGANIAHIIDGNDVRSLLLPDISRETDIYNKPNSVIVICDNPDKTAVMRATAENRNPDSPLSIPRRGKTVMHVERLNNIASQTELQAYADRILNEAMYGGEIVELTTGLFPWYGVDDVIALRYDDYQQLAIRKNWTMNLQPGGDMTCTLERVVANIE